MVSWSRRRRRLFKSHARSRWWSFGERRVSGKSREPRGIADRAYRESLGLTAVEFVDLRRIEVQKEIVQHSPAVLTVIMGLARVRINIPSLAGGNLDGAFVTRVAMGVDVFARLHQQMQQVLVGCAMRGSRSRKPKR